LVHQVVLCISCQLTAGPEIGLELVSTSLVRIWAVLGYGQHVISGFLPFVILSVIDAL
jgi:hypothetical protein